MNRVLTRITRSAFLALFSLVLATVAAAADITFRQAALSVQGPDGKTHALTIELALSNAERMQGLMYRKAMPADHGMLFDFGEERLVTMWMRNTVLPLDMLFIDEKGVVQSVRERAVPFSESIISSGGDVRYVLEVNAGTVKRLGIGPGSTMNVDALKKSE